jgi:hypothetical protein
MDFESWLETPVENKSFTWNCGGEFSSDKIKNYAIFVDLWTGLICFCFVGIKFDYAIRFTVVKLS